MTKPISPEVLASPFWDAAKIMLRQDEGLMPVLMFFRDANPVEIIPIPDFIKSPERKDVLGAALRSFVKEKDDIYAVLMITEAWTLTCTEEEKDDVGGESLEDHPRRVEKLILTVQMRNGSSLLRASTIERDSEGKVSSLGLTEDHSGDNMSGRLFDIFPQPQ